VIFEGPAEEMYAMCDKRGGERVAGETAIRAAIKREFEWPAAVDAAALRET
jgi:hypothetical protein